MVDTAAAPPLKLTSRRPRPAALSNSNAGSVAAAFSNANAGAAAGGSDTPKPKAKTVASRYLAPFSKPRSASPSATAPVAATAARRSASPAPSRRAASAAERVQLPNAIATADAAASSGSGTATTRTLSVAFQSPTHSLDTGRARLASPAAAAAAFPREKKRSSTSASSTRSKVYETGQNTYRWPASATVAPSRHHDAAALATSLVEHSASNYKRSAAAAAAARSRAFDEAPRRASVDGANEYLRALSSDDTDDSASSGGSRDGVGGGADRPPPGAASGPRPSPRSIMSSRDAMGTRSDRFAYPAAAAGASPSPVKKRSLFNGLLSAPFRRPSPSKPVGGSFRMAESPSRPRRSVELLPGFAGKMQGKAASTNGIGIGDMKLKTPGPSKAEEEHQLKLLYSRHLQWRYANALAGAAISSQRKAAEKTLYGAWVSILRVRKSIAMTKLQLQLLQNNCKLMAILRGQMVYLEEWSSLERVYANSLSGTAQALNATVLRLPVSDGAMADIQGLKNVVGSAIDVMQSIGNSTSTQLSKLARANVLLSQLSRVSIQEIVLLTRCRVLLSTLASMHVKHCSLQGQRIQLNQRRLTRF